MTELNAPHAPKNTSRAILPVVEKLITAYKLWQQCKSLFPKELKYTIGEKIDTLLIESLEATLTAAFLQKELKRPFVHKAVVKLDTANVLLRVAWELKAMDTKKYAALSVPLSEAGQQLGGWHNQLLKQNSPEAKRQSGEK